MAGDRLQVVADLPVHRRLRVAHDDEDVLVEAHRHDLVLAGLVTGQQQDCLRVDDDVHDLDELEAGRLHGASHDVLLGHGTLLHEHVEDRLAHGARGHLRGGELVARDEPLAHEDVGDGRSHRTAPPSADAGTDPTLRG